MQQLELTLFIHSASEDRQKSDCSSTMLRQRYKWALNRCFRVDFGGNVKEGCRNTGMGEEA